MEQQRQTAESQERAVGGSRGGEKNSEEILKELSTGCKDKVGKRHGLSGILKDL